MEDSVLTDDLQIRCSPKLKQAVRVSAAKEGLQMSEYIRRKLRTAAGDEMVDREIEA